MPLFASKKRYRTGDLIVASTASLSRRTSSSDSCLVIVLGAYETYRPSNSRKTKPIMEPYHVVTSTLNGQRTYMNLYDGAGTVDLDSDWTIQGVLVGKLSLFDTHEANAYLKLCSDQLVSRYRDRIVRHMMEL